MHTFQFSSSEERHLSPSEAEESLTLSVKSRGNFWQNVVLLRSERPFLFMNRRSHPRLALNSLSDMLWDFASSRARSCNMSCVIAMLSFLNSSKEVRNSSSTAGYFPAFGPRWIPEFLILFLLHVSRTVPQNLSLLRISMFHRAFFNSIIDKHQHMHFFTFKTVLV